MQKSLAAIREQEDERPTKSSGSPSRPSGIRDEHCLADARPRPSSSYIHAVRSERKTVGAIALTVIPCLPHSQASASGQPVDGGLGGAVGGVAGGVAELRRAWTRRARTCPPSPCSIMRAAGGRQTSQVPRTFASITDSHSSTRLLGGEADLVHTGRRDDEVDAAVRPTAAVDHRVGVVLRARGAGRQSRPRPARRAARSRAARASRRCRP